MSVIRDRSYRFILVQSLIVFFYLPQFALLKSCYDIMLLFHIKSLLVDSGFQYSW